MENVESQINCELEVENYEEVRVPKLRFPGFEEEWKYYDFNLIASNKSKKFNPKNTKLNFKCIELEHVEPNTGRLLSTIDSEFTNSTKNKFNKGQVLYGKLRPYLNKYYLADFDGICSSEIWVLTGKKVTNEYLYFLIQTSYFRNKAIKTAGSKMPRADWKIISETDFCISINQEEQQKIASYLTTIDRKIELLEEKKEHLEQYIKAMMQQLFSQQIRFKDDDGNEFPEWEEKRLGDISIGPKYGLNSSAKTYDGKNGYIRITDIDEKNNKFIKHNITSPNSFTEEYIVKDNDILLARTGASVGKSYLFDKNDGLLYFAGFLIRFNIKKSNDSRFVFYNTLTHKYYKWVKIMSMRSGQPGINAEEYFSYSFGIPCLPEQQKIADFLTTIDTSIETVNEQINQTKSFKKAMLQQLFV